MEEPNLSGGLGGSPAEGDAASAMGNSVVNSRLSVDLRMLQGLNNELKTLNEHTKKIKSNFKDLIKNTKDLTAELNKAATAMGKISGKSSSGYMDTSKGMPAAADLGAMRDMQLQSVERILGALDSGGDGGGDGGTSKGFGALIENSRFGKKYKAMRTGIQAAKKNPYFAAGGQFADIVGAGADIIDSRVDRNRGYALPADRLSVQLQQQYGMSQMDVMTQLRAPLRGRRLGIGGINELLSMQSRMGISASQQAGSVEGLRTLMGFGFSAGDVTDYIESLGQADTVNRMFMMTGTSLYGIGGRQKSAMQVNQDLIQRLGLNNRELIAAGRQSGSVVRQRLQMAGLDEGAQNLLLQYAESNVSFAEKGGKGFYDPSKKSHRERMGIEGNYATQAEETERTTVNREEQMYKRQADNYAQMEQNLQRVNKVLGQFEDHLSSIIGMRTSTRGMFGGQGMKLLGGAAMLAGGIMSLFPGAQAAGVPLMMFGGGMMTRGDATSGGLTSPGLIASENRTKKPTNIVGLSKLKPVLRDPLAQLLADRPGISIGQGYRSPEDQKKMFLERYYRTNETTDTYYDGSYWLKKPGVAIAAPPGLSYHEIGLAADLVFATSADAQWFKNNASKYGLDEFSRHGEPWHVQSKAYPASRRQYEQQGAPYGTDERTDTKYVIGTSGRATETGPAGQSTSDVDFNAALVHQMSIAESIAQFAQGRTTTLLYGNASGNSAGAGGGRTGGPGTHGGGNISGGKDSDYFGVGPFKNASPKNIPPGFYYRTTKMYGGWGYFVPKDFDDADINALLQNETGGKYNVGGPSVTTSHGKFWGGFNISDYNWNRIKKGLAGLSKDPKGLRGRIYDTSGWAEHANDTIEHQRIGVEYHLDEIMAHDGYEGIVKGTVSWPGVGKLPAYNLGSAVRSSSTSGDPSDVGYSPTRRISASTSSPEITTGSTNNNVFNINPTINLTSTGSVPIDAAKLAKEVTKLIDREVKMNLVRSS